MHEELPGLEDLLARATRTVESKSRGYVADAWVYARWLLAHADELRKALGDRLEKSA